MSFNSEEEIQKERSKWKLTDEELSSNFNDVYNEMNLIGNATNSEKPTFVMIGGQAGCGKSILVSKKISDLEKGAIAIDQDVMRTKHPRSQQIQKMYTEREEFIILKSYVDKIIEKTLKRAQFEGKNLILETALRSVSKFCEYTKQLKEAGYKTQLSILAVHPDEANLSMFTRACEFLKMTGDCRRNTRVDNNSVERIPINIESIEKMDIFDEIEIFIRENKNNNYRPIQVYSSTKSPDISAFEEYKKIIASFQLPYIEFHERCSKIREVLYEYHQDEQIKRLDNFVKQFDAKSNKGIEL